MTPCEHKSLPPSVHPCAPVPAWDVVQTTRQCPDCGRMVFRTELVHDFPARIREQREREREQLLAWDEAQQEAGDDHG